MRAALPALLLVLLVPTVSAQDAMPWPGWDVGDEWAYFVRVTTAGIEETAYVGKRVVAARENLTFDGVETETIRVVEIASVVDADRVATVWAGKPLEFDSGVSIEWFRASDGASMKALRLPAVGARTIVEGSARLYPHGCNVYGWPILPEGNRTDVCVLRTVRDVPFHPLVSSAGTERLTVAAGSFDTIVVDVGAEARIGERQWYAPEACWRVKALTEARVQVRMELLGYRCGGREGGALNPADPPLDLASITDPGPRAGVAAPLPLLALLGALALRRKPS